MGGKARRKADAKEREMHDSKRKRKEKRNKTEKKRFENAEGKVGGKNDCKGGKKRRGREMKAVGNIYV